MTESGERVVELKDLIESIDIVEYISQYVSLTQKGEEWWGLSCFKEEKTASFSVRQNPPRFYDYSSGIGGNVYTFVRYYNKCSPSEAVEILRRYAGIEGETVSPAGKLAATLVCKKYQPKDHKEKPVSGIELPDNCMDKYESRPDKLKAWEKEGISGQSLERFQVRYDGISDRLVYPIRNPDGKIVNIGGRTLDPEWKQKKLRKYTYFYPWGTVKTIYGLAENMEYIRKRGEIILFEGCKSVLIADTWGLKNTGALLTSHLNANQMKILAKLGCHVVFALDKDADVRSDRNIAVLKNYVNVSYLLDREGFLGEKDSPVDKGKEVFRELYSHRLKYR